MNQKKSVNILILELYSQVNTDFERTIADLQCDHLLNTKSIDEFEESLQFEPVNLVLISSPASKKVLLDKAISISRGNQIPFAVISEEELELDNISVFSKSDCGDDIVQLIESHGYKINSIDSVSKENTPKNLIDDSIFVKSNQQYKRIPYKDILFIKSDHVYLEIHTIKNKYLVRASFKEYAEKLPSDQFYRAHKSYMVNINHISVINLTDLIINQVHIPISREFKAFITKSIQT